MTMATYSSEELRRIFQSPFNQEAWKAILRNLFRVDRLRTKYEPIPDPSDNEEGFYMGASETSDNFRIGLFYYRIKNGSVAHKKVGLRNLVKKFINRNWGVFDAAIVVFDSKPEWRLSFVCDIKEQATAPKRFTFVFGEPDNRYRTPIERFERLQNQDATFENIRKAFSVDALSDDFFKAYRNLYADFVQFITGKRYVKEGSKWIERELGRPDSQFETTFYNDDKLVRDYIKKMFGRIVFLYFLQRKGWLNGNRNYMHDLFAHSDKKDNFLDGVLEPLFFEVLNTDKAHRSDAARALPGIDSIPYLNGGLFARDEIDERTCVFPESYFTRLFDFLDSYNFTIDENDLEDAEIGIDPEMLGRIFENLLEDNKDKGTFYTPKEIVSYMCRESIIAYLQNDALTPEDKDRVRHFVETYDGEGLSVEQRASIKDKLKAVKICDPAIGSGAFPMGLVNLLAKLYSALRISTETAVIKRHIMEKSIYGVDIEKGAVDIARLRFWLAMIVEEKEPMPLPNLHFKIMQGNSLLESYQGIDLSKLTKVEVSECLFESDDYEREDLAELLRKYYKTTDHTKRDRIFNEIIKNVRRQLIAKTITLPSGLDPSANTDFFLWHTWFSDVFEKGGFDIVIGNPPYFVYQDTRVGEIKELRQQEGYEIAFGGKLNAYKLFLANSLRRLVKANGITTFIFQNSFLGDLQAANLREYVIRNQKILHIDSYPERDSKKKRVFESVKMSVCVVIMQNTAPSLDYRFSVDVWEDKDKSKGLNTSFSFNQIRAIDPVSFTIPRLRDTDIPTVIKLIEHRHTPIKCIEGELNMTFHKKYFGMDTSNPVILKGAAIQRYNYTLQMSQGEIEYLSENDYLADFGSTEKSKHHSLKRIAMQGMTGANDKIRLVMSVIPEGFYLANSCNYILPPKGIDIFALLAILNSTPINWFFRCFSTNSNVNGYEVDNFPIPQLTTLEERALTDLACKATGASTEAIKRYSKAIDNILYHTFGLEYSDILIIDSDTPITLEEYENFNIEDTCLD